MDDTPPGDARAGSQLPNSDVRTHAAPPRLRFRVPPEPSHLRRARERIRDYLRQYSAERDLIDDLVLCVEEAATNAIRHSGVDTDIEIALEFDDGCLVALVKDRGVGFDVTSFRPERVPDPGKDHGRGLFIIAALMDSLDLSVDGGLEVRMKRKTAARPVAAALDSGLGELSVWGDPATTSSALEQREARTRALLDEVDEAFVALDWEYRYVHANRMAVRMLERSLPELLGRTLWELFPHLADDPLGERFRDAMELGKPSVSDHRSQVSGDWIEVRIYPTSVGVSVYYREIAERKRAELERETTIAFLHIVNESETLGALADATIAFFERHSGCEAVGLRLRDGDDYPYVITRGLSPEFVALERSLAGLDDEGRVCRDAAGHATLECLCGDVVGGRLDPAAPYTTTRGSFWCNDTAELLATIDQNARQAPLRGRCMSEGYQSVALVGLRVGDERLGLLQLNDRRTDRFAAADIELLGAAGRPARRRHLQAATRRGAARQQEPRALFGRGGRRRRRAVRRGRPRRPTALLQPGVRRPHRLQPAGAREQGHHLGDRPHAEAVAQARGRPAGQGGARPPSGALREGVRAQRRRRLAGRGVRAAHLRRRRRARALPLVHDRHLATQARPAGAPQRRARTRTSPRGLPRHRPRSCRTRARSCACKTRSCAPNATRLCARASCAPA